jgi:hypothetical protein
MNPAAGSSDLTLLAPFYVNGTLGPQERRYFEAALAADPKLRSELEIALEISGLVKDGGADLAPPLSQGRLWALLSRIERESASAPASASRRRLSLRRDASAPRQRRTAWKPAFAAAAVLVIVQAGVIAYQAMTPNNYASLSGPAAQPSRPYAPVIILRLSPDSRWADMEALLSSRGLTIVDGPRGGGIDVAIGPDAKIDEEVRQLRASPLIEFAAAAS